MTRDDLPRLVESLKRRGFGVVVGKAGPRFVPPPKTDPGREDAMRFLTEHLAVLTEHRDDVVRLFAGGELDDLDPVTSLVRNWLDNGTGSR